MHVVMSIQSFWLCAIETAILFHLCCHDVLEGTRQPRVENGLVKPAPNQKRGDFLVAFLKAIRRIRGRKRGCEVYVEASIEAPFLGYARGSLRILHENHGAGRSDRPADNTIKNP